MTRRTVTYPGTGALFALLLLTQGCGSNTPATTGGAGGGPGVGGTQTTPSTGGATTAAAGGTTTAVSTGGSTGTATGGAKAAGGSTGAGTYSPACVGLKTAAGVEPAKTVACTAADVQLCYRTCGPASSGFKSETCTGGAYAEQSGCSFPPGDYSCYKIPTTMDASCPATAPQANTTCNVAKCTPCNVGGKYLDSGGASKDGWCICPETTGGVAGKWSCGSTTAWPCPAGQGC
jgi:hypothetical protein